MRSVSLLSSPILNNHSVTQKQTKPFLFKHFKRGFFNSLPQGTTFDSGKVRFSYDMHARKSFPLRTARTAGPPTDAPKKGREADRINRSKRNRTTFKKYRRQQTLENSNQPSYTAQHTLCLRRPLLQISLFQWQPKANERENAMISDPSPFRTVLEKSKRLEACFLSKRPHIERR